MLALLALGKNTIRVRAANARAACIQFDRITRLWIDEPSNTDVGEVALAWILDRNGHDIVTLRQQLQGMGDVILEEIRHDEHDGVLVEHSRHVIDRANHIGSFPHGLERENVADDTQHVTPSLSGRYDVLDTIGEQKHTDPVVVSHSGHRQYGGQLTRQLTLEPLHRPETL
jgi:hypothetical protein